MLTLILGLLWGQQLASAEDALWKANMAACGSWTFDTEFTDFVRDGKAWQAQAGAALTQVKTFSSRTCPHYLNRANAARSVGAEAPAELSTITLAEFVQQQQEMARSADSAFLQSQALEQWIRSNLAREDKISRAVLGTGIEDSACAKALSATHREIEARNLELRGAIDRIQVDCPGIAGAIAKDTRPSASLVHADGGPARGSGASPAGHARNPANTITGLEQDATKAERFKRSR